MGALGAAMVGSGLTSDNACCCTNSRCLWAHFFTPFQHLAACLWPSKRLFSSASAPTSVCLPSLTIPLLHCCRT